MTENLDNDQKDTKKTKLCGIIGKPLDHSLSPIMHNAAFKALNLDFQYLKFEIGPDQLGNTIQNLLDRNFRGLNVTIPYKCQVIEFLDKIEPVAQKVGAVNTIVNEDGVLTGFNTDAHGALEALHSNNIDLTSANNKVLIIGAGGAARAVAFALAQEGLDITIVNRTFEKAETLANDLSKLTSSKAIRVNDLDKIGNVISIIINCIPLDLDGNTIDSSITLPNGIIGSKSVVFDIVYNPKNTPLINKAKQLNAQVIYGYEMLVFQGARSFELWTGEQAPIDVMRTVMIDRLRSDQNDEIILTIK